MAHLLNLRIPLVFFHGLFICFLNRLCPTLSYLLEHLSDQNHILWIKSSFFIRFAFAHSTHKCKTLPVLNVFNLLWAHINEPLPTHSREVSRKIVLTDCDNDITLRNTIGADKLFKVLRSLKCIKYFGPLHFAVSWIDNSDVQPSIMFVLINL